MRRDDRAITLQQARELLAGAEHGVLSMASTDGVPHGIPLNFAVEGDSLYFHCAPAGRKIDVLAANDRVSFCVVGATELLPAEFATRYESVVVTGRAEQIEGEQKQRGLVLLVEKYSPAHVESGLAYIEALFAETAVFRIRIESVTGKARR